MSCECAVYECTVRVTAVGRTEDEAFEEVLRKLKENPEEAIEEDVVFDKFDFFYLGEAPGEPQLEA